MILCWSCQSEIDAVLCHEHHHRVTELLTHNNELLERARKAEADAMAYRAEMLAAARVAGNIARLILESK